MYILNVANTIKKMTVNEIRDFVIGLVYNFININDFITL